MSIFYFFYLDYGCLCGTLKLAISTVVRGGAVMSLVEASLAAMEFMTCPSDMAFKSVGK